VSHILIAPSVEAQATLKRRIQYLTHVKSTSLDGSQPESNRMRLRDVFLTPECGNALSLALSYRVSEAWLCERQLLLQKRRKGNALRLVQALTRTCAGRPCIDRGSHTEQQLQLPEEARASGMV